jgi:hypothetical protein
MSNENGIRQSPFSDAWPTPDVGGTGLNGIGGGLDSDPGSNGIVSSPFAEAVVPTPSGECTPVPDLGGKPPYTIEVEGGNPAGSQAPWDITSSRNTVDRK